MNDAGDSSRSREQHTSISAVVHTYNESAYIEECLRSVQWVDELVIIDMESTDDTVAKCRQFTDSIHSHPWLPTADPARDFGLSKAASDWILVIDPDERVSAGAEAAIRAAINEADDVQAYAIRRRNFMFGREIRFTGWGNEQHLRIFRRGRCAWSKEVHGGPRVEGGTGFIGGCHVEHINYTDWTQFVETMNRYTSMEADRLYKLGRPFHWLKLFYQPSRELWRRYVTLKGYKDGLVGLMLSLMMAVYTQVSYIKLWELYDRQPEQGGAEK